MTTTPIRKIKQVDDLYHLEKTFIRSFQFLAYVSEEEDLGVHVEVLWIYNVLNEEMIYKASDIEFDPEDVDPELKASLLEMVHTEMKASGIHLIEAPDAP